MLPQGANTLRGAHETQIGPVKLMERVANGAKKR